MFLCDDCHNPDKHLADFRSFGRCENCGKTKACIDCHERGCVPKKLQRPKPDRRVKA